MEEVHLPLEGDQREVREDDEFLLRPRESEFRIGLVGRGASLD